MNFIYDGTENMKYEFINRTTIDVNVMNMSLIITKLNYDAIDYYDTSFHGYCIIRFS